MIFEAGEGVFEEDWLYWQKSREQDDRDQMIDLWFFVLIARFALIIIKSIFGGSYES